MSDQRSHLVIFDCDGTLVDSERLVNRYFVEQVNKLNIPLSYEEAWAHFPGTSLKLCMEYVERTYDCTLPENFVQEYRRGQKKLFAEHLEPIDGVAEAVAQLQHHQLCVASNGPLQIIRDNLITTGLAGYFESRLFSAYELGVWKPNPALFIEAAESLGFPPDRCLVIEDSAAGIAAGLAAEMQVFAYQAPSLSHHPAISSSVIGFDSMAKLPDLIAETVGSLHA